MEKIICVVDDTPDLLTSLSEFLQMEGFHVRECSGGKEALVYLEHTVPDLIITDLWMPAMDGLIFIEKIKNDERLRGIPILIFSAKAESEYAEKAKALGVTDYLKKPAELEEILNEINRILN